MSDYATIERAQLCDTALAVGPTAPTLCEGWNVRDLMAHLAMRERRPEAAGIILPALADAAEKVRRRYTLRPFTDLVDMVRQGPHELSVLRIPAVNARANLFEYFIHHEDILRAQPGFTEAGVRALPDSEQKALADALPAGGRLMLKSTRIQVVALCPDRMPMTLNKPKQPRGEVVIQGLPSEIVLNLAGRTNFVSYDGEPEVVNQFISEPRGF